ncbi:MAG: hypothetical protein JWN90_431 [Parcubacteria group bacterium]|nr:hypothetical protein [Parcubacteria group bacterium]
MKKFIALYMMPVGAMEEMMKNSTPEQRQEGMAKWMNWMEEHKADLADQGSAFGKNTRVTKNGSEEVRNEMGGYSIIQAESKEEAIAIAQTSPNFDDMEGGYIELMETLDM